MAKSRYGRIGGVLMQPNSCRQLLPALAVAVPSLLIYFMAMGWMYYEESQHPVSLMSVDPQSKMVQKIYAEDEAKGQEIIREMDGKVANPLWMKLVRNKKVRGAFAAALGSAASTGGNAAFDIGNMLSGLPGSGSHVQQHRQAIDENGPEERAALPSSPEHSSLRTLSASEAAARYKAKLAKKQAPVQMPAKKLPPKIEWHKSKEDSVPVVYNAFAPGVLSGSPAPHHEQAHIAAPPKPEAKPVVSVQDVKKNLEKVTGFADNYAEDTSAEAKLSHKVEELKRENKAEHAKLVHNQQQEEEKRLKLLTKVEHAKAANAAAAKKKAKDAQPRFDGKFSDFVGGKDAAEKAGKTDRRVFGLLKSVEGAQQHVPTSHEAKDKAHEDKEQAEADKLMKEIEAHASIISSPAHNRLTDPLESAYAKAIAHKHLAVHDGADADSAAHASRHDDVEDASKKRTAAEDKDALYKSVDGVRDWRTLARKSKQLARNAPQPQNDQTNAMPPARRRQHQLHQAKWVTKVKKGPLPYECGMPLVAEASGFDCAKVQHVRRVPGNNHILHDIQDVGLGDSKERSGDLQPMEELVPSVHVTPAQAIKALGYSNAHQYERHALLKTIAKEEDTIQKYKARDQNRNGGLGRLHRHHETRETRAETRKRLEREIEQEKGEVKGYEKGMGLGGMTLKHALADDVGHLGDRQVPVGAEQGDYDLGLARY